MGINIQSHGAAGGIGGEIQGSRVDDERCGRRESGEVGGTEVEGTGTELGDGRGRPGKPVECRRTVADDVERRASDAPRERRIVHVQGVEALSLRGDEGITGDRGRTRQTDRIADETGAVVGGDPVGVEIGLSARNIELVVFVDVQAGRVGTADIIANLHTRGEWQVERVETRHYAAD